MTEITPEGKLLDLIRKAQGSLRLKKELRIFTKINILLIVLLIVILVIFLIDILTFDYKIPELDIDLVEPEASILPVSNNSEKDVDKDIVESDFSIPIKELAKDLNLLGIVTGDDNQAVIEDKGTKKTFFLYEGEELREFTVYDIKESSVILDYKGERIELKI